MNSSFLLFVVIFSVVLVTEAKKFQGVWVATDPGIQGKRDVESRHNGGLWTIGIKGKRDDLADRRNSAFWIGGTYGKRDNGNSLRVIY